MKISGKFLGNFFVFKKIRVKQYGPLMIHYFYCNIIWILEFFIEPTSWSDQNFFIFLLSQSLLNVLRGHIKSCILIINLLNIWNEQVERQIYNISSAESVFLFCYKILKFQQNSWKFGAVLHFCVKVYLFRRFL